MRSSLDYYVVRIYRRDEKDPYKIAGTVEFASDEGEKSPFQDAGELIRFLASKTDNG